MEKVTNLNLFSNGIYEHDYIEIRPLILSVMRNEELVELEKSEEFRIPLIKALRNFKLLSLNLNSKIYKMKITDIIKYSNIYKRADDEEKWLALYYELTKFIPGYFITDYYSLEKEQQEVCLQIRDKVCEYVGLQNIIKFEKYEQFQSLCLNICQDKYDRLVDLNILIDKLGDNAKYFFIHEIFNVKDPLLTKDLINSVPTILNSNAIKKIKLKAYYQGQLNEEVLDYIIDNNLYKCVTRFKNGDLICKMLMQAKNNESKFIDKTSDNKINWFIKFFNEYFC